MNGQDLSQYTDKELEDIVSQPDLSGYTDKELEDTIRPKTSTTLTDIIGLGIGATGAIGAGVGIKKGWDYMAPLRTKVSGHFVNQLIKPRHREFMFGKNPGQAVAQEGLWDINIEGLGKRVENRLGQLRNYAKNIRELPENKGKTTDFSNVIDPFIKVVTELGKAPETHGAKINEIYGMVKDLEGNIPKNIKISKVPVDLAYQIKDIVENMQRWNVDNPSDKITNAALKQVYHNIDVAIDKVLPLEEVNSRMANLISAKQAIKNQVELLRKRDPLEYRGLINLATTPIRSTAVKTGLAKILSEKFGFIKQLPKTGMSILGVYPMISQALGFATDPEAAMVGLETGGMAELAPKGSLERRIQLGEIA